jgi:hypothetical protein
VQWYNVSRIKQEDSPHSVEESIMRKLVSFIAGAMCGAIVGAVAALLLAPASGIELRQMARSRFDEMLTEGRQAAADRRAELEAQLAALRRPTG